MRIAIIASAQQKELFSTAAGNGTVSIDWYEEISLLEEDHEAEAIVDLLFEHDAARLSLLKKQLPRLILVNSVIHTLEELPHGFVRFNGWDGFITSSIVEASAPLELQEKATAVFKHLQKQPEWLPDAPGFVTARVISMIINEAFLSLEEGVSSEEDINTAMKLGTNYPYGPFEWAARIGVHQVYALLEKLSRTDPRYTPASLLQQTEESC